MKAANYIWGLWPSNELNPIVHRRWLYMSGLYLYSRPYADGHPRTRGKVYSRPHAWSGGSAAFSFGSFCDFPLLSINPALPMTDYF